MTEPTSRQAHAAGSHESPPPFLGTWRNVYLLVIGELVFTILVFLILTRWAS